MRVSGTFAVNFSVNLVGVIKQELDMKHLGIKFSCARPDEYQVSWHCVPAPLQNKGSQQGFHPLTFRHRNRVGETESIT